MNNEKLERLVDEFFPNQDDQVKLAFYRRLLQEIENPDITVKTEDGTTVLIDAKNAHQIRPRINKLTLKFGYSQTKLSEISGVPQSTLSRFDRAERHVDWHLFTLANAFNCRLEDLFEYKHEN